MRQVRDGPPTRPDTDQGLRIEASRRRAASLQIVRRERPRMAGDEIHYSGRARRLHRLRRLRGRLSGEKQIPDAAQSDQYGAATSTARAGAKELGFLSDDSRNGPPSDQSLEHSPAAAAGATV